jgi:hypothetical protein
MLSPDELRLLHPRKRLVPFVPPTPKELTDGPTPPAAEEVCGRVLVLM